MKKRTGFVLSLLLIAMAFQVLAYEFCEDGVRGENNLRLISIDDMLDENAKEWEWQAGEDIELEARVENRNDESGDYAIEIVFIDEDEDKIKMAEDSDDLKKEFSLSENQRNSISITFQIDEDVEKDKYDMFVKLYKRGEEENECVENSEEEITIEKIEICEDGNVDKQDLEIKRIEDKKRDNAKEWEWTPGNDVKITVDLENKDYSERNFIVELIMLNKENEEVEFVKDISDLKKEIELDEDEDDKLEFFFELGAGLDEGVYTLYAKAYDEDNEEICTSLKAESSSDPVTIEIKKVSRKVIVTKIEGPKEGKLSSKINYTATIINLGSKHEEKVSVFMYNRQLKLKGIIELDDLDSGEERKVVFEAEIPDNATLSMHRILFSTGFEYDDKFDNYRSASDDEDDKRIYLTLSANEEEEDVEEIVENEDTNETIIETPIKNKTETPSTVFTGNVVGKSDEPINWLTLLGFVALAGIGVFLFLRRPKLTKQESITTPNVTRRYTARLN